MSSLDFRLLTDGSSDQCLIPLLHWLFAEHHPGSAVNGDWSDLSHLRLPPKGLSERMKRSMELYPCDVLFVHRDAEGETREKRVEEIHAASKEAGINRFVCVVPVRMTEAWLLSDETAIRRAAGNPNGKMSLNLPNVADLERIADPKVLLHEALRVASGRTGRRLDQFRNRIRHAVHLVPEHMSNFTRLRHLSAFRAVEEDVRKLSF